PLPSNNVRHLCRLGLILNGGERPAEAVAIRLNASASRCSRSSSRGPRRPKMVCEHNAARAVTRLPSANPDGTRSRAEGRCGALRGASSDRHEGAAGFDLLLYTGVRRSDVVKLGPQMERDGKLVFTETNRDARKVKEHAFPILAPLRRSIDA